MNLHMLTRSGWVLFAVALFFSLASVRLISRRSRETREVRGGRVHRDSGRLIDHDEAGVYLVTAISVAWLLWLMTP